MKKFLAAGVLLLLCVGAVAAGRHFLGPKADTSANERDFLRSQGEPKAELWIVEYLDYQCSSCKIGAGVLKDFMARYPGKIYLQVRFYPSVKFHRHALKAALYAECAARQGKFWPFHELVLEKQEAWSRLPDTEIDAVFENSAAQAGVDTRKLAKCLENPSVKQAVMDEKDKAMAMGVKLTPTFYLNGRMVVGPDPLKAELENYFGVARKEAA
ncbi:MAG: DsbA family protein [Candidatus Omnitrophota bacterium]